MHLQKIISNLATNSVVQCRRQDLSGGELNVLCRLLYLVQVYVVYVSIVRMYISQTCQTLKNHNLMMRHQIMNLNHTAHAISSIRA